jgi:methionyl-tRNA formyltransferase
MSSEKILFLGAENSPLLSWLKDQKENVMQTSDKITPEFLDENGITFLISYGYRHILRGEILNKFPNRAINLHISYLPWNRGADPNFWSFVENSPKGVTIHYLDEGIDTGDIITQKEVMFSDNETLATTYEKLQSEIRELFKRYWEKIKTSECKRQKQTGKGSFHRVKDIERLSHLLADGWNTRVSLLEAYAAKTQTPKGKKT